MTFAVAGPVIAQPAGQLRRVEHPDLSPLLTHFCRRGRPPGPGVPPDIAAMTASHRLALILQDQQLRAFTTFSGGDPAVCFSEATRDGLEFLISQRGYEPWALVFDRQSIYDAGGGPVYYARPPQYVALGDATDPAIRAMRAWAVRLDPGSDWLEEKEWRIVLPHRPDGLAPFVALPALRLAAVIVGDHAWNGVMWRQATDTAGVVRWAYFLPPLPPGLPRWWWNPTTKKLEALAPLC